MLTGKLLTFIAFIVLIALWIAPSSSIVANAQEEDCSKELSNATPATPEKIRKLAQTIRELKELLGDSDSNVRVSALNSMLNSCNLAIRELGYEVGFASAEQAMRALSLKHKLLTMKQFVVELVPPEKPTKDQWERIIKQGIDRPIAVGNVNLTTGEFSPHGNIEGSVNGLELRVRAYGDSMRFRLEDGAIMKGTVSVLNSAVSVPARIILR